MRFYRSFEAESDLISNNPIHDRTKIVKVGIIVMVWLLSSFLFYLGFINIEINPVGKIESALILGFVISLTSAHLFSVLKEIALRYL